MSPKRPAECHPDRPHQARGLCHPCYQQQWREKNPERRRATVEKFNEKRADCHPDKPETAGGLCEVCYRRKWRDSEKNRAGEREYERKRYREMTSTADGRKIRAHKARASRFGLTVAELDEFLNRHGNRCEVCGAPGGETQRDKLCIDHCHKTGVLRGILCHTCNRSAGLAADDPNRLRALADYLEERGDPSSGSEPPESPSA